MYRDESPTAKPVAEIEVCIVQVRLGFGFVTTVCQVWVQSSHKTYSAG